MAAGMFGNLFQAPEDLDREEAYAYARLSPEQQLALRARQAQQGVERGVQSVARGLAGQPSEGEGKAAASAALRELAKTVRPGTKEFYTAAIPILTKNGMVAEADAMQAKLNELLKAEREATQSGSDVEKYQRTRDDLMKRLNAGDASVRPAIEAIDRKLMAFGTEKPTNAAMSDLGKLVEEQRQKEPGSREWQIYEERINKLKGTEMSPAEKAMEAFRKAQIDRWNREDTLREQQEARKAAGEKRKLDAADQATVKALQNMSRALGLEIKAGEDLLAHKGLGVITGVRAGTAPSISEALVGKGALALMRQVHAQSFIRALQSLKATSATGASGLGQLTEREGDKIQNAQAALDPQQPTDQFKRILRGYIDQLKSVKAIADSEITGVGETAPPTPSGSTPTQSGSAAPAGEKAPVSPAGEWSIKRKGA